MDQKEDIAKKLEEMEFNQFENPSHKTALKKALLDFQVKHTQKPLFSPLIFTKNNIAFSLTGLVTILLLAVTLDVPSQPQYTLADAEQIAIENQQIKGIISRGGQIQDIKIIDQKAYILITSRSEEVAETKQELNLLAAPRAVDSAAEQDESNVLAEISISEKRVVEVQKLEAFSKTQQKATIIYESNNEKKEAEIDVKNKQIESVKILGPAD